MSRDPNMAEQQAKDTQGWKECEHSLLDLIRKASDAAYKNSLLPEEQKHDVFASGKYFQYFIQFCELTFPSFILVER